LFENTLLIITLRAQTLFILNIRLINDEGNLILSKLEIIIIVVILSHNLIFNRLRSSKDIIFG